MPFLPTALVALGAATVEKAEHEIVSCRSCNEAADTRFCRILDLVTNRPTDGTNYLLPRPAECPNCSAALLEYSLVERLKSTD